MTVEELLKAAWRLSDDERRRLVKALQEGSDETPVEEQRREVISSWVELAGQFHSNFADVSTNKYRHLADVYADER